MTIVILEISGGCLQAVRSDSPELQVILLDHDNLDGDPRETPFVWTHSAIGSDPNTNDAMIIAHALHGAPFIPPT